MTTSRRIQRISFLLTLVLFWLLLIFSSLRVNHAQAMPLAHSGMVDAQTCVTLLSQHDVTSYTIEYADKERRFLVLQPASYISTTPAPLVFAFHGGGGSALEWFCRRDDIRAEAERQGFLAVFPTGSSLPGQQGFYWNEDENISYTEYLIDWLVGHYAIDQARIYATGFSGGAQHAFELVGDAKVSRRIAAIGTVAGRIGATGYMTEPHSDLDPALTLGEPTSGFLLQGALDERSLINGEQITHPVPTYFIPFAEKVQIYADHLGAELQTVETITKGITISTYQTINPGHLLNAAVDPTLEHAWPDYPLMSLFWEFFELAPTQTITHNTGAAAHLAMLNSFQPATSVNVSDMITFETTIWNSGGESVNLARVWTITEPMPAGFQPTSTPIVEAIQGNVIPLRTRLDRASKSWVWQGVLGQDAVVRVRIPGIVRRCPADGMIHGQAIVFRHDPILSQALPSFVPWDITVNGCGAQPAIEPTFIHTVTLNDNGFSPANLRVTGGSVVEVVNATDDWRSVKSGNWESGLLISGDSSKMLIGSAGMLTLSDGENTAMVVVAEELEGVKVFLPMVVR